MLQKMGNQEPGISTLSQQLAFVQIFSQSATATARTVPLPCWYAGTTAGAGPLACTWPLKPMPRPSLPMMVCK